MTGPLQPVGARGAPHRNDLDVMGVVHVTVVRAVHDCVAALCERTWGDFDRPRLRLAFALFESITAGREPGFLALDTPYHDVQHSLDVVLCTARLLVGHELSVCSSEQLGSRRALLGLICALYHDVGYLRRSSESHIDCGARLTATHVSRSSEVLQFALRRFEMSEDAQLVSELVHFTGYERAIEDIDVSDERDRFLGYAVGTADLLGQLADRCYLEKVRDRLFLEFAAAGLAGPAGQWRTPEDLLAATPEFIDKIVGTRLQGVFDRAYRWLEPVCGGFNPYLVSIDRQQAHLRTVIRDGNWAALRRRPPSQTHPLSAPVRGRADAQGRGRDEVRSELAASGSHRPSFVAS